MTDRRAHDPFAAHSRTSGGFPAARLSRAGVGDEAAANLAAWYAERSPEQQAEFRKSVNGASDTAIRERFTAPDGELGELLADQLHDLALAAGVPTSGTKAEVAARITEAQQDGQQPETPEEPATPPQSAEEPPAGQQQAEEPAAEPQGAAEPAADGGEQPTGQPAEGITPQQPEPPAAPQRRRGGSGKDGN